MDDRRNICTVFGEKYNSLYNSVPYDAEEMNSLKCSVDGLVENRCGSLSCYASHRVSPLAIDRAIKQLKPGKSEVVHYSFKISISDFALIFSDRVHCPANAWSDTP